MNIDSLHNFKYFKKHQQLEYESQDTTLNNNLEIKQSKIKNTGNGVFTKVDIQKGQIVTIYSPSYIIVDKKVYTPDNEIITDIAIIKDLHSKYKDYDIRYYNTTIMAIPHFRSPKYLGHLINDKGYKLGKIYKSQLNNCQFYNNGLEIISTRDIKAGDELYVTYGKKYWYDILVEIGKSRNEIIKENSKK